MSELEEYKYYYSNGKLAIYYFTKNDLREGEYKSYYPDGKLSIHCYHKNDLLEGEDIYILNI